MTNHYETLGVPRDATADEIRAAGRRAAREAHPDRAGGSHEQMQAVNAAREVLLDPERRARYDATGDDGAGPSLDQLARDALVQLFTAAIENGDAVLGDSLTMLQEHRRRLSETQRALTIKVARLNKRSGKVRAKRGENLVQHLIDEQIRQANAQLDQIAQGMKVNDRATEMLKDYEEDEPPPSISRPSFLSAEEQLRLGGLQQGWFNKR